MLVSTRMRHVDLTGKWDMRATHPATEMGGEGTTLQRVHFNERTRGSWGQAAAGPAAASSSCTSQKPVVTAPFYAALRRYGALVDDTAGHSSPATWRSLTTPG